MLEVAERETLPVAQARDGDARAWDALFRRYQLPLYVYARELLRDEQASLDVVQEAFISAARHLGALRDDSKFGSWLFSIAHQKCLQRWRKLRADFEPLEDLAETLADPTEDPSDWAIRHEREEEFMKALDTLPDLQREVILLHFLEGFKLEEIAAITQAPLGTVKSRVHQAKLALRQKLENWL